VTDNVAVIRRVYDATAIGDFEAVVRECDPEVEYISLVSAVEGGRSYQGHEGMRQFFSDLREAWDVWIPQVEHLESDGDAVLAVGTSQIRGRGSGLDLQFEWGQVFHLRDGKVLNSRIYGKQDQAEAAFRARA
jgi:ketosteroid isomerase-like protein